MSDRQAAPSPLSLAIGPIPSLRTAVLLAAVLIICLVGGWLLRGSQALVSGLGLGLSAGTLALVWLGLRACAQVNARMEAQLAALALKPAPQLAAVAAEPAELDDDALGRLLADCQAEQEIRRTAEPGAPPRLARDSAAKQQSRLAAARVGAEKRVASGRLPPAAVKRT